MQQVYGKPFGTVVAPILALLTNGRTRSQLRTGLEIPGLTGRLAASPSHMSDLVPIEGNTSPLENMIGLEALPASVFTHA